MKRTIATVVVPSIATSLLLSVAVRAQQAPIQVPSELDVLRSQANMWHSEGLYFEALAKRLVFDNQMNVRYWAAYVAGINEREKYWSDYVKGLQQRSNLAPSTNATGGAGSK